MPRELIYCLELLFPSRLYPFLFQPKGWQLVIPRPPTSAAASIAQQDIHLQSLGHHPAVIVCQPDS